MTTRELIAKIKSDDPDVRTAAWQSAGGVGARAMKPLAALVTHEDLEVGRAAKRGMWKIVRTVGAPDADGKTAVTEALIHLLGEDQAPAVRREAIWMLSEIADGGKAVASLAALLGSKDLREDARCALERIPGHQSLGALRSALAAASGDFKSAVAHSLRVRGVQVPGVPCLKMKPTKQTSVRPVGR